MDKFNGQYQKLPPGWDCKYDQATGNCYYINYFTKAMQLEDPRMRYKQLQNERSSTESIPLQPLHGSPYHVYPTNNLPALRAFHAGPSSVANPNFQHMSASPLLSSRGQLEMSPLPLPRTSNMQTPRLPNMSRRSTIQETSFSNQFDTDGVVAKIQNMFPTASENHIRLLLKRYMKNIFPKADEMLLLDILASEDNNVQQASEKLLSMGYEKREVGAVKATRHPSAEAQAAAQKRPGDEKIIPLRPKEYTDADKEAMRLQLKEKYPQIAERIIVMALESVNYAEDRAMQILQIVQEEDEVRTLKHSSVLEVTATTAADEVECAAIDPAAAAADKNSQRDSTEEADQLQQREFKSLLGRLSTMGHNTELVKGPDENLLLADYVTWNGANPDISFGHKQPTVGPDVAKLSERSYTALGRNPDLCKGAKVGLAKGSIYAQLSAASSGKNTNIKCN